jgi:hypothetical protein
MKFGALYVGANQPRHFFTKDTEWIESAWDSKQPVFGCYLDRISVIRG